MVVVVMQLCGLRVVSARSLGTLALELDGDSVSLRSHGSQSLIQERTAAANMDDSK